MPNTKETKEFGSNVAGNSTETETAAVDADCTIYRVDVRFYRGPALGLVLSPFVDHDLNANRVDREEIVDVHGRDGIVGDDDRKHYFVDVPVKQSEEIGVEATNQWDPTNWDFPVDFDYNVRVHLDYEGGTDSTLVGRLAGVFG